MKKLLTLLALCTATTFAVAQTTMNIYQSNGSVLQIPLSSIDSITYTVGNPGQLATLTTLPVGNIASTSATSGGNVTANGGTAVTQRGVVWSTSPNPTTANSQSSDGSGTGNYTSNLTGLTANTTYYVRAYATNSAGTAYGNQLSFTTTGGAGSITALNCNSTTNSGTLTSGTAASGVSSNVPYTGGNGGTHNGQTVNSTGVTGLTATLSAGNFASGSGSLTYTITGTPSAAGTANFSLNIGGQNCTLSRTVNAPVGSITALNCNSATNSGTLTAGTAASGVSSSVPYTGGNGGSYSGQTVSSTGVTGLTATLSAGSFANGAGSLTYTITGTPSAAGTANFALNIGGQNCTLSRTVSIVSNPCQNISCGANGSCLDGDCICDTGYEGVNCQTEMREKFLGNYLASEAASGVTDYASSIANSSTGVNKIAITGFGGWECNGSPIVVIATVNGMDVTVDPNQSFCAGDIVITSGSGSINASGTVVTITYSANAGGSPETWTTVYTRV